MVFIALGSCFYILFLCYYCSNCLMLMLVLMLIMGEFVWVLDVDVDVLLVLLYGCLMLMLMCCWYCCSKASGFYCSG